MKLAFYTPKEAPIIQQWLTARNCPVPPASETPAIGYLAYDAETPIAAAFLRRVEGGYGQVDGLVSNPECSSAQRHEAIELVVKKIIKTAKELKIKQLISFTVDAGTLMRSQRHGFVSTKHAVLICDLSSIQENECPS